jgi:hypothetical protein
MLVNEWSIKGEHPATYGSGGLAGLARVGLGLSSGLLGGSLLGDSLLRSSLLGDGSLCDCLLGSGLLGGSLGSGLQWQLAQCK